MRSLALVPAARSRLLSSVTATPSELLRVLFFFDEHHICQKEYDAVIVSFLERNRKDRTPSLLSFPDLAKGEHLLSFAVSSRFLFMSQLHVFSF